MLGETLSLILTIPFTAWVGIEAWLLAAESRMARFPAAVVSVVSWLYFLSLILVVVGVIEPAHWSPIMRWPGEILWTAIALTLMRTRRFVKTVNKGVAG